MLGPGQQPAYTAPPSKTGQHLASLLTCCFQALLPGTLCAPGAGQFKNKMASLGNMLKRSHLGGGPTPEPSSAEEGGSSQNGGARHGNSVDEKVSREKGWSGSSTAEMVGRERGEVASALVKEVD
eukprot:205460-Pelagomonas_calceolata.AAC.1